jgi:hypothetical protein
MSRATLIALAASAAGAALFMTGVASAAKATPGEKTLTIYSVATQAQFINHADDRARGEGSNPFEADTSKLVDNEKGKGPFPGDDSLYSFNLYKNVGLTDKIGTAVYTCHYNFTKNALCVATYDVNGSTLLATGPVLFTSKSFTLAITGGTNKFFNANGEVAMSTVTKSKQRLAFLLLGS